MTEVAVAIPRPGGPNPSGVSAEQEHLPYPNLASVVLGWFKQTSRPRNWCLKIALSPYPFSPIQNITTLVLLFSTFIYCQVVDSLVVAFFVLEMLVKMLAKGCFGYQGSYLGNRWHRLDLFINCGVLFGHFMENVNFHFQICRVLGPMRLVSRVTSIRDVFAVLMDIFPMLLNVLFLYLFVVHIFGVMGVQLWAGLLRNRCFLAEDVPASMAPYYTSMYDDYYPYICSTDGMSGMRRCHNLPPSVENGQACTLTPPGDALGPPVANACVNWNTLYNICRAGDLNPSHGAINFDNIGYAWIAIFQVITMEGWSNIMFYVMDAYSFWCFVFFVLVTIVSTATRLRSSSPWPQSITTR
uniref:Ion transport domain-containing protein n=1 Tax=Cyclopterus lumpus TaxID=8103 RepID=A0A8C2ZQ04_CYCLU